MRWHDEIDINESEGVMNRLMIFINDMIMLMEKIDKLWISFARKVVKMVDQADNFCTWIQTIFLWLRL